MSAIACSAVDEILDIIFFFNLNEIKSIFFSLIYCKSIWLVPVEAVQITFRLIALSIILLSKAFKIEPSIISIVEPGIDKLKIFKKNKSSIKHFLTCGSLIERKNYDYLIKEIKNIENIIINIVGNTSRENDYTKKLIDYINKNNLSAKVILHGQISQFKLDKLYSQCDFYISTSKYEGFGMALANASISKLPIISFKTSTIMKTIFWIK